jgi:L-ribulose-5-phosphate 3-epimerase
MSNRPLAGHTSSYRAYTLEEALEGIAHAGFAGVEITAVPGWSEHIVLDDCAHLNASLEQHRLTLVAISAHADLTTREGLDHTLMAVRWARAFGLSHVNAAIGDDDNVKADEAALLRNVAELADAAEELGVVVGFETEGEIMGAGASAAALMEKIGRRSIGVTFDTANVEYFSGRSAVEELPKVLPHVVAVHLKDWTGDREQPSFPPVGTGTIDFPRILELLRERDFDGPISVEVEHAPDQSTPLADVHEGMRAAKANLSELGLA